VQELLLLINYCGHSDFSYAAEYRACQYDDINYSKIPRRADGARACTLLQQRWKRAICCWKQFCWARHRTS